MSQCECNEESPKEINLENGNCKWKIRMWHHSFQDKFYRNKVLMYKEGDNNNKIITIICFNPGTLHSDCGKKLCDRKDLIGGDLTLRNIIKVFENSNHILEILNVFNINESKMKKVKGMYQNGDANKLKNNYSIKDYLSKREEDDLVFIQWGKEGEKEYAKKEFTEIRNLLAELNLDIRSLPVDNDNMHPSDWERKGKMAICKQRVEEILRYRNEKTKEIRKSLNPTDTCLPRQQLN